METFTLDPRCWQVFRIVGRNPLLRRCDRIEALVALAGIVVTLLAVPFAGLAASVVYTARDRHYAHEALTRQMVTATIVTAGATDPGSAVEAASQPAAPTDGDTNPIRTGGPAEAGQHIKIWVDPGGKPVHPPTPSYRAVIDAAVTVVALLLGTPIAMWCLLAAARWRVERARDAQWEREIRCLQSDTGRSNQQ